MSRVEKIENQIKELSQDELTALREWFADFDADAWDRQMEADISAGRLDSLAERALLDHSVSAASLPSRDSDGAVSGNGGNGDRRD